MKNDLGKCCRNLDTKGRNTVFTRSFGQVCSEFPWHYCVYSSLKIAHTWKQHIIKFWQHWVSLPTQQGVRNFVEICTDFGRGYFAECGLRNVESCQAVICRNASAERSANYPLSLFRIPQLKNSPFLRIAKMLVSTNGRLGQNNTAFFWSVC